MNKENKLKVMQWVTEGKTTREIGKILGVSHEAIAKTFRKITGMGIREWSSKNRRPPQNNSDRNIWEEKRLERLAKYNYLIGESVGLWKVLAIEENGRFVHCRCESCQKIFKVVIRNIIQGRSNGCTQCRSKKKKSQKKPPN